MRTSPTTGTAAKLPKTRAEMTTTVTSTITAESSLCNANALATTAQSRCPNTNALTITTEPQCGNWSQTCAAVMQLIN